MNLLTPCRSFGHTVDSSVMKTLSGMSLSVTGGDKRKFVYGLKAAYGLAAKYGFVG